MSFAKRRIQLWAESRLLRGRHRAWHHCSRQANAAQKLLHRLKPDHQPRAVGEHPMRVAFLKFAVRNQPRLTAACVVARKHFLGQVRSPKTVVVPVKPQAWQSGLSPVGFKRVNEASFPVAVGIPVLDAQAASKVDQPTHARKRRGAQRHGRQPAMRLADDNNTLRIHVRTFDQ